MLCTPKVSCLLAICSLFFWGATLLNLGRVQEPYYVSVVQLVEGARTVLCVSCSTGGGCKNRTMCQLSNWWRVQEPYYVSVVQLVEGARTVLCVSCPTGGGCKNRTMCQLSNWWRVQEPYYVSVVQLVEGARTVLCVSRPNGGKQWQAYIFSLGIPIC